MFHQREKELDSYIFMLLSKKYKIRAKNLSFKSVTKQAFHKKEKELDSQISVLLKGTGFLHFVLLLGTKKYKIRATNLSFIPVAIQKFHNWEEELGTGFLNFVDVIRN